MQSLVRIAYESLPGPELVVSEVYDARTIPGYEGSPVLPSFQSQVLGGIAMEPYIAYPDQQLPDAGLVELVPRPPEAILRALRDYPSEMLSISGRGEGTEALAQAAEDIGGEFLFVGRSAPGMMTTTTNPRSGLLPGLHVDNRDNKPYDERRITESRRRLVINAGPGYREALICFPDIVTLGRVHSFNEAEIVHGTSRMRALTKRNLGDITCARLLVPPGQGYIANTDAIGHDGSTISANKPSLVAYFLGNWKRGQFSQAA